MNDKYILDGHTPVLISDIIEWCKWHQNTEGRSVGKTQIGTYLVSTVFLGLDHSFNGGKPVLFETMIFETHEQFMDVNEFENYQERYCTWDVNEFENYQERYCTWDEAAEGHNKACEFVKSKQP